MIGLFSAALDLVYTAPIAQGSSDSGGGEVWMLLFGPLVGGALYGVLYRYYRNTDKSHSFEKETRIESQPVTGSDVKVDSVRGTQRSLVQGHNVRDYRERVRRV
ncbi:MAG: hypothetical protein CMH34_05120 [Microbacterium sp.]|uniref:hypothetical protein n=1 Tax=Microbacterium aquimaris TaxID=459816 RepID=UPI000C956698|nr:hypothetical protein [Microbacterium aquimaris]MAP63119.1 hypothetical protein [Microbacterium sp.]MDZ8275555.1 hypothetical protein [Microbacterium aquimaris]